MDYGRYGRQIALAEIGVAGQARIASARLRTCEAVLPSAVDLWTAAGGDPREPAVEDLGATASSPTEVLGVAAWSCVESARVALGAPPHPQIPADLLARLTVR